MKKELSLGDREGFMFRNQRGSILAIRLCEDGSVCGWFTAAEGKCTGRKMKVCGCLSEKNILTFNVDF
jgi:hypothetical protein